MGSVDQKNENERFLHEVYEDDVDRNYSLLVEVMIALRDTLRSEGLPHVKDFQAI